jgi:hypothetical protein
MPAPLVRGRPYFFHCFSHMAGNDFSSFVTTLLQLVLDRKITTFGFAAETYVYIKPLETLGEIRINGEFARGDQLDYAVASLRGGVSCVAKGRVGTK